jgi:hypothetical protein
MISNNNSLKALFLILILFVMVSIPCYSQSASENTMGKLGKNPVYYLDSVLIDYATMMSINPDNITVVTVLTDKDALGYLGERGKDGVVLLETKAFARKRFRRYFSSKSAEYANLFPTGSSDESAQYILNGKLLTGNYEGNLSSIDDKKFISLEIIPKKELKKRYDITDKKIGILVQSKISEDLNSSDK